MQLTVTAETAKEIIDASLMRVEKGAQEVKKLVEAGDWVKAAKYIKGIESICTSVSNNIEEVQKQSK